MSVRTLIRKQTPHVYSASQETRQEISRGALIRELRLYMEATITAASGNAISDSNILPGDEWGVVQEVRIEGNNNQILWRVSGEQLRWLNAFQYGNWGRPSPLVAGVAGDATATIKSSLRIPFWSIGTHSPVDTLLDTRKMSRLDMVIRWGTVASITSATSAAFGSNPVITPITWEQEMFGSADRAFSAYQVQPMVFSTVAVQDSYRVTLPVDCMYRGFLIATKDADGHDHTSNYIDNIKLVSGPTVFLDVKARNLQDMGYAQSDLVITHDDAGNAIDDPYASAESNLNSWYYIDLLGDGGQSLKYLTECPDALGLSEFALEFKVTTEIPRLHVIPIKLFPVRMKK